MGSSLATSIQPPAVFTLFGLIGSHTYKEVDYTECPPVTLILFTIVTSYNRRHAANHQQVWAAHLLQEDGGKDEELRSQEREGEASIKFYYFTAGWRAGQLLLLQSAAGTHRATSDSGPQLSSWAKLTLERVLFHPLSSAQLWHFSSLNLQTLLRNKNPPSSLQDSVALCFHIEMWVWKCTAAVSYLSWFAANSAQSGLGQAASRGLTAARRPAAPAQPSLSPRANVFLGLAVIC